MAFLTDKNQLFFKEEGIQCSTEDKHVFVSPFVFPKPSILKKEEAINSDKSILFYDKTFGDYQIICALYHVDKNRFKIRKYLKPINNKPFSGIHIITGTFHSEPQSNIFHFKGFSCDFYVSEDFLPEFSANEIFYIVTHLFERKEKHSINYIDSLKKYITENSLINNKPLTFERLQEAFSEKDILEYGLVHFEHTSTKYHTEKEAYSDALIAQLKHPIILENGNTIKSVVLIHQPNENVYEVNFIKSYIFDEDLNINWKKRKQLNENTKSVKSLRNNPFDSTHKKTKGDFYISDINFRGINFFNGKDYLKSREEDPIFSKFSTVFSYGFTFFNCVEDYCTFSFEDNRLDGNINEINFGDFFTTMGLKSKYSFKNNQIISPENTNLKDDVEYALSLHEYDIANEIINQYKVKKELKEGFFFESKHLNEIIEDQLYLEQNSPEDFELLKMNYQDIDLLVQYIVFVRKLLLESFEQTFKENESTHILEKVFSYLK